MAARNLKLHYSVTTREGNCGTKGIPFYFLRTSHVTSHSKCLHSQVKCLLPDRVEVAIDGLCPLFGFAHLDSDIRITGAGFILGLQTLSTQHWEKVEEKAKC